MDIRIRCPNCRTKLIVGDDLLGQSVRCEECGTAFAVEDPANAPDPPAATDPPAKRPSRRSTESARERTRESAEDDDEWTIDGYEFDDGRPIRQKPRTKPNALVPFVFGGALATAMLLVAVGLFFAFGFGFGFDGSGTAALPPGAKFRITSANWVANHGFLVEVETASGGLPPPGRFRVAWRSTDGTASGTSTLTMKAPFTSQVIPAPQPRNRTIAIWIEPEPPAGGGKVSNEYRLP
jgi:predicted Zn finger-like uncharacterized protein